jgi:hypothetical protein
MDQEKQKLLARIAQLEFQNDQLGAELSYDDQLLRAVGFTEGLASVKAAALELSHTEQPQDLLYEDGLPDEPPGLDD